MGHGLMDKVVAHWGDLPGNAFKALMLIAATALDDDARPVYWGGWERIAITGLGRRDWPADDDGSPEAEKLRKRHWEAVRAALSDAKSAGAISVKTRGKPGSRAEYWLHLDPINTGKPCVPIQEKPADLQEKPADPQENPAPKYPQSPQSSGEIITSSPAVPHQALQSPVDKAMKSARTQELRDRLDREQAAS
jgi:hypothetical protein